MGWRFFARTRRDPTDIKGFDTPPGLFKHLGRIMPTSKKIGGIIRSGLFLTTDGGGIQGQETPKKVLLGQSGSAGDPMEL